MPRHKLVIFIEDSQGNDIPYSLEPIIPAPGVALRAWKLTKGDGTEYTSALDRHGPICTCADGTYRRPNSPDPYCKHTRALHEMTMLEPLRPRGNHG